MTNVIEPALGRSARASQVAAAAYRRWAGGEPPDAAAVVAAHPQVAADKPLVLELAYEEFCLRAEAGRPPDPVVFAAHFPFAESVARLLAVHSFIDRHPSLGGGGRPTVQLQPGEVVGDLRVRRRIGRGGFADVYLVDDPATARPLVLKVSARGGQEARTLGPLTHPHLMPVWGAPLVGDHRAVLSPYLGLATGEAVAGPPAGGERRSAAWLLGVAADRRPDDPAVTDPPPFPVRPGMSYERAVLHVAAAVADALRYLHANGVAHRDLKPSNLLLASTAFPYLLDFNLAADGKAVRAGGTVAYAAPEVLAALAADGPGAGIDWFAADVFSFAVTVCELLLGRHPYLAPTSLLTASAGDVSAAAADAARLVASTRVPLPPAARRLLLRCLAADPTERPTAAALARGLTAVVAPRRWRWAAVAAVGVTLAAAAGAGANWRPTATPTPFVEPEPPGPFDRGCQLCRQGHPGVAIPEFIEAAKTDDTGRADECLAYCYAASGSLQLTIDPANKAEAAGRKTVSVYANRAAAHYHSNKYGQAIADAEQALAIDADCTAAQLTHALARLQLARQAGNVLPRSVVDELDRIANAGTGLTAGVWGTVAEARAGVANPTDADRDRAVDAVRKAMQEGAKADTFRRSRPLAGLKDRADFQAALEITAAPHPPAPNPQFVCPIP